jgi:hypothetical protein
MGTIDSNGIYFYEDTDAVSPLHTLLNVGQQSVSDALETVSGRYKIVTSRPASSTNVGDTIFETSTGLKLTWDGTRWKYVSGMATIAFRSPSLSTANTTPFGWGGSATIDSTFSKNQSMVGTQTGESITITEAGVYTCSAVANFAAVTGPGQLWYVELSIGGVIYDRGGINAGTNAAAANFTLYCAAGTVVTPSTYQNSGTAQVRSNGLLVITRHA